MSSVTLTVAALFDQIGADVPCDVNTCPVDPTADNANAVDDE